MNNNDILRRLRYTFDFNDTLMMKLFELGGKKASRAQISDWLKKDDDPDQRSLYDIDLAIFLNGFITHRRGKKDGPMPKPEKTLINNQIFRKLKIALDLRGEDIVDILALVDMRFSKHEINAFFRRPTQSQYRLCKDQVLRNFIYGLQMKYRGENSEKHKN